MDTIWVKMLDAARAALHPRTVSQHIEVGGVSAAVLSESGKIYTGICVDTSCTLGICAERNAIFHMLTMGEHRISRILAMGWHGNIMSPCGACRELMTQLMPKDYQDVEVLMDAEQEIVVTLGALTPQWWVTAE